MTKEEFIANVWDNVNMSPKCWRKGQAVFNVIDDIYGVARVVQFTDGIDCFYNDDTIDAFIEASWNKIKDFYDRKDINGDSSPDNQAGR